MGTHLRVLSESTQRELTSEYQHDRVQMAYSYGSLGGRSHATPPVIYNKQCPGSMIACFMIFFLFFAINPFNAEATFIKSTRVQRFLKPI